MSKNKYWGSKVITPKGQQLFQTITQNKLNYLLTHVPNYKPITADIVMTCSNLHNTKINPKLCKTTSCFHFSSDHSTIFVLLRSQILPPKPPHALQQTHWDSFRTNTEQLTDLKVLLKSSQKINLEASCLTCNIQNIQIIKKLLGSNTNNQ